MYTLREACAILNVSRTALNRWIAESDIQTITYTSDRKRRYISREDLARLAVKAYHRLANLKGIAEHRSERPDQQLYSIAEVAQAMDVSIDTVGRWLSQHNIEKQYITTDRKRVYITFFDFAHLANQHKRKVKSGPRRPKGTSTEPTEQNLCTLKDAAQYLGVCENTVRAWLTQNNIERKYITTDNRRVYIYESDVIQLKGQHPEKLTAKDFCTLKEAARYLGVSKTTVVRWLEQRKITPFIDGTTGQRVYVHYTDVIRLGVLHPKKTIPKDCCTLNEAAQYFGVSTTTIRKWLAQAEISPEIIGTIGQRVYIRYSDLVPLAERHAKGNRYKDCCTLREAAQYFGVTKMTVLGWLEQCGMSPEVVGSGNQPTYICRSDIARLEEFHPKKPSSEDYCTLREAAQYLQVTRGTLQRWLARSDTHSEVIGTGQSCHVRRSDIARLEELHPKKPSSEDYCTLREAARRLGVSNNTVKRWLVRSGISPLVVGTISKRIYVRHTDVLLLEQQYGIRREMHMMGN